MNAKSDFRRVGAQRAAPLRIVWLLIVLSACAAIPTPPVAKIALFAPFEGRYREVGYEALYAARLALADVDNPQVELLAVDDGGTQAARRAAALTQDPQVAVVIALGYAATDAAALAALDPLPVLVVGGWDAQPAHDSVFILSNQELSAQITAPERVSVVDAAKLPAPVTGGDAFALDGFAQLRATLDGITVLSSGSLPDTNFAARYASDPFAPPPGLLATLTYDAARIAVEAALSPNPYDALVQIDYAGINGGIRFEGGYWLDAPIHHYRYVDGTLTADDAVK